MNEILRKYQNMLIDLTLDNKTIYLDDIHKGDYFDFYKIRRYSEDIYRNLINFIFSKDNIIKVVEDPLYWHIDRIDGIRNKVLRDKEMRINNFVSNDNFEDIESYKEFLDRFYDKNSSKNLDLLNINYRFLQDIIRDFEQMVDRSEQEDIYIGYPFVEGYINKDNFIRLPLFLIPITLIHDNNEWFVEKRIDEGILVNEYIFILINKIFDIKGTDFPLQYGFDTFNRDIISNLIEYLMTLGIKFKGNEELNIKFSEFNKGDIPKYEDTYLGVKNYLVMGRFNNIPREYNDYEILINSDISNTIIERLLSGEKDKDRRFYKLNDIYVKDRINFSEKKVISISDYNDITVVNSHIHSDKNTTICNLIIDKLSKGNKILVVSKNSDFLNDIYNRFDILRDVILNISKDDLRERVIKQLDKISSLNIDEGAQDRFNKLILDISDKYKIIEGCNSIYNRVENFGLSLQEMYELTMGIFQDSGMDSNFLERFSFNNPVSGCTFSEIVNAIDKIKSEDLINLFINYMEYIIKFKIIDSIREDFKLEDRENYASKLMSIKDKYKEVVLDLDRNEFTLKIAEFMKKGDTPKDKILEELGSDIPYNVSFDDSSSWFKNLSFLKNKKSKKSGDNSREKYDFNYCYNKIDELNNDISFLYNILKPDVFNNIRDRVLSFENITDYIDHLYNMISSLDSFLSNKSKIRELNIIVRDILEFIYNNSINESMMRDNLDRILKFSIFTNIVRKHDKYGDKLLSYKNVDTYLKELFELFRERREGVERFSFNTSSRIAKEYIFENNRDRVIREVIDKDCILDLNNFISRFYDDCLMLFPCFLINADDISSILPMVSNMFDYIIFEDGHEYFVHDIVQYVYRGKRVIIFGDNDQVNLNTKGYSIINSDDDHISYNLISYLQDKHSSYDLNYIYPNRNEILRDISECMFKDNNYIYMPIREKYKDIRNPFEIIKIKLIDGDSLNINLEEFIINLLFKIFKTKNKQESISIITLTKEQKYFILKIIEDRLRIDEKFNLLYYKECQKYGVNGIYISSIDELEYEERDILILFLGIEGDLDDQVSREFKILGDVLGKNKLNILTRISRSCVKIVSCYDMDYIKVNNYSRDNSSMFMRYLYYANEISKGNIDKIMREFSANSLILSKNSNVIDKVYDRLVERGLVVEKNFGTNAYTFDIAIYDNELKSYILFIEFEGSLIQKFKDTMERYVDCFVYFDTLGYNVLKIWSKDLWSDIDTQINNIIDTYNTIKNSILETDNQGEYLVRIKENFWGRFVNVIKNRCNQIVNNNNN